jgi:hypothetical protein
MKKITLVLVFVLASSFTVFGRTPNSSSSFLLQSAPAHVVGGLVSFSQATARFFATKYRQISSRAGSNRPATASVVRMGPPTTFLQTGLNRGEVIMLLGVPQTSSETWEGSNRISTCVFARSEGRVLVAEFRNDVLVSYRVQPAGTLASVN